MTSFQKTNFWSDIVNLDAQIPDGTREYLRARLRNELYNFVLKKFLDHEEHRGLSKAHLARRINCDPAQLNRLLGAPGNWTLATVSDLLAGISGEALIPHSISLPGHDIRNMTSEDFLQLTASLNVTKNDDTPEGAGSSSTITVQVQ